MKEKTFIQKSITVLNTHTHTNSSKFSASFQKKFAKKYPPLPITDRIFLITKSRETFIFV